MVTLLIGGAASRAAGLYDHDEGGTLATDDVSPAPHGVRQIRAGIPSAGMTRIRFDGCFSAA
jgi:hypothetical protein